MADICKQLILVAMCVLCCGANTVLCDTLTLKPGVVVNDSTLGELSATSIPYAVAMCGWSSTCDEKNAVDVIGFTNLGSGSVYYSLGRDMKIRSFDISKKMDLGGWPLTRTAEDSQQKIAELSAVNEWDRAGTEYDFRMGSENPQTLGCLWDYPLRYGDVNGDGQTELVVMPGEGEPGAGANDRLDFIVFSLQSHSVIFSIRLAREAIGKPIADHDPAYKQKANSNSFPQITDRYAYSETDAAMRYYAKLYFGDFNGDGKPDIIAWRKRYDSRLVSDPVQGYKLTAELLTLYELDNGIYKAQSTDEATIKGWLAAKSLTWQKGYPQTSECAGQTGQPISEMVDPLLNDPDVLK
jgi:hypothetical protein